MIRSAARSISLLVVISLFAATPGFSFSNLPAELCALEGCNWVEESCLCLRDVEQLKHAAEVRSAKAYQKDVKSSPTYLALSMGAVVNFYIGAGFLASLGAQRDSFSAARGGFAAVFLTLSAFFGSKAVSFRNS